MALDAITREPDRGIGEEALDQLLYVTPSDDIIRKGKTILEAEKGNTKFLLMTAANTQYIHCTYAHNVHVHGITGSKHY